VRALALALGEALALALAPISTPNTTTSRIAHLAGTRPVPRATYTPGAVLCTTDLPTRRTALSNAQNPLGMSNANAVKTNCVVRNAKTGPWPVWDPRAAPPGGYGLNGLKSGENGHLARANGAIDGPYCSSTWPSACRRQCEPLVGRGGGGGFEEPGVELHLRIHSRPWGAPSSNSSA
jgi:hypothetical protein